MKYECKSVIMGKKSTRRLGHFLIKEKYPETHPVFVNLCRKNDPHLTAEIPFKFLNFEVHKIIISGLDVNYLVTGTDIVINDLEWIDVQAEGHHLFIRGKQSKKQDSAKQISAKKKK